MIKRAALIIYTLAFFSCNSNRQEPDTRQKASGQKEVQPLAFSDIIPGDMPDSSKVVIIDLLVREIENDTSLTLAAWEDTLGAEISAYLRDDKLVKIITGTGGHMMDFSRTTYYFFMDKLVHYSYECNRTQQTGRCNPVSAFSRFYFYNDQIISQRHNINIPHPYEPCGCTDLSIVEISGPRGLDKVITQEVTQLKQVITYKQKP